MFNAFYCVFKFLVSNYIICVGLIHFVSQAKQHLFVKLRNMYSKSKRFECVAVWQDVTVTSFLNPPDYLAVLLCLHIT